MEQDDKASRKVRQWIERAANLATENATGGYHLGAIVVKGGSVLSMGSNRHRNSPIMIPEIPRGSWSFCAEETALRPLKKDDTARGATLYVARVTKSGRYGMARPCNKCAELLIEAGITKICYTTRDGGIVMERIRVFAAA